MIGLRVIKIVLFTGGFIPRGFRGDWHLFHELKGSQAYMGRKVNHSSQLMLDFGDADFPPVIGALASAEATTQASSGGDSAFVNQTIDQTVGEAFEILVAPSVAGDDSNACSEEIKASRDDRATLPFLASVSTKFTFHQGEHAARPMFGVHFGAGASGLGATSSTVRWPQVLLAQPALSINSGVAERAVGFAGSNSAANVEAASQCEELETKEAENANGENARVGTTSQDVLNATPAQVQATRNGLKQYRARCVRERVMLPKLREGGEVCLDQLADEAKVERALLALPEIAKEVERLVADIGVEVISPAEESFLQKLKELWQSRKAAGLPLPCTKKKNQVSIVKVARLIGLGGDQVIRTRPVWRLIQDMAADLGVVTKATPSEEALRLWVATLRRKGLKIPALRHRPNEPWMVECARQVGIDVQSLRTIKAELYAAGAELGYDLRDMAPRVYPYPLCATIRKWAEVRIQNNRPCPRHSNGKISLVKIRDETGIPLERLSSKRYRDFFRELVRKVGLAPAGKPITITLERLHKEAQRSRKKQLEKATAEPATEKEKKEKKAAINGEVRNLRHHLNKLIKAQPQGELALARPALEQALATKKTKGKYKQELSFALKCLLSLEANDSLPQDLSEAVAEACARQGVSLKQASCESGNHINFVTRLKGGHRMGVSQLPCIRRLEQYLHLSEGALSQKVEFVSLRPARIPVALFPAFLQRDHKLRRKVLRMLDRTDANLPPQEFEAKVMRCVAIIEKREEVRRQKRIRKSADHSLSELPSLVKEQFENICRAVSSSNDVRAEAIFNGKLKPGKTRWKASTIVGKGNALRRYFGFLSVAEKERGAVLPEDATLALAVFPRLTVRYPLWLMNNRPVSDAKSLKSDFYMLDEFRSWLAAGGLLTQQPELAKTLRPVAGVISDDDIARVQQDWVGACREAYDEYSRLLAARPASGDNTSLMPIMPILKLKDPSIVVRCMIEALSEERRSVSRGSIGWARLLRDEVYLHIQLRFAFRTSTILSLTPNMISVGEDGIKWIDVDRMLIKNGETNTFKLGDNWINYLRPIEDGYGSYEAIDLYLNEGREILLQGRPDHGYLMVSATGIQMLSLQDFTEKLTTRYLITNPKAPPVVRGMLPLYNHAFRHIVACSTLRSEGLKMAAWVLMDSEPTVENFYGFLNEEDMNARYLGMVMARHGARVPAG